MPVCPQLVVGLGNPGREYAGTRHNIGFEVVDRLAEKSGCSFKRKLRFAADVAEVMRPAGKIMFAKPRTFMNRSGTAVAALAKWLKIAPSAVLVVVDDADLPAGEIRLRTSGGSGGHNGLQSVIEAFGNSEEFARLRVGIGRSGPVGADITGHVLSRFGAAERPVVDEAVKNAVAAIECCVENGLTAAMNQFNRKKENKV